MEYRKLIKFGNSSHVISLPSDWVKKNSMEKGDLVYLEETTDGELVLSAKEINGEVKKRETDIKGKNIKELQRKLISSYIAGYDIINIHTKNVKQVDKVKFFLNSLISFEIIEQTENNIVIKNLLDLKGLSLKKKVKRIDTLIRSMFEDSKLSHKEKNHEDIYRIDYETTKLTYLGQRIIQKCLDNPRLLKEVEIKSTSIITLWELFKSLENIGDGIKIISKHLSDVEKVKNFQDVLDMYSKVQNEYIKVMNAYYKQDKIIAYDIASRTSDIINECDDLISKVEVSKIISILEHIKNIELSIKTICRSVYE